MSLDRERDRTGRPRNARPRDALGRPLPRGDSGVVGVPDDLVLAPGEALIEAQRLLDEGLPFQAHEVLEASWKAAPDAERDLWQGLAQLAVGLTHALRGNNLGAVTLLRRGAARVSGYAVGPPHGIDVTGLVQWARTLAGQLDNPSGDAGAPTVPKLLGT
jgi:uncharacterized protein